MPSGLLPSLNDSQRDQKSYGGILASVFVKPEYLGDLKLQNYQLPDMWIEGLCLLNSTSETFGALSKLYVNADQGQIIFRNATSSNAPNSTYLCLQVERDMARYASEQHGQGDPGNYILYSEGSVFAQDPGYGNSGISAPLNHASNHNTVYFADSPGLLPGDGPSSKYKLSSLTNVLTNTTGDFGFVQHGEIEFGIRQEASLLDVWPTNYAPVDVTHNITERAAAIWLKQGRPFYNPLGKNTRTVYFVNGEYFIVLDKLDLTEVDVSEEEAAQIKYKVNINGVNGDFDDIESAVASPSFSLNQTTNTAQWTLEASSSQILQASINSIGGLVNLGVEAQQHELGFNTLKYHGKLVAEFNKRPDKTSHLITILEPQSTTPYTATIQRNNSPDNYLLYTVNGTGTGYGRYDLIFSQDQSGAVVIPASKTGNELKEVQTDARFLVMSFGANKEDMSQVKIFSKGMSYLVYGDYTFLSSQTSDIKTEFTFHKKHSSNDPIAFSTNSQRKVIRTNDGVLHMTYTSLGKVWYEFSTDNGATWQFGNNGQPIGIGLKPAIDLCSNSAVIIAFHSTQTDKVWVKVVSQNTNSSTPYEIAESYTSGQHAIACVPCSAGPPFPSKALVVWKILPDGIPLGPVIQLKYLNVKISGTSAQIEPPPNYSYSGPQIGDEYASSLTLAGGNYYDWQSQKPEFHLAWERTIESNIYYAQLSGYNTGSGVDDQFNNVHLITQTIASNGSGYYYNIKPSITSFVTSTYGTPSARVSWIGQRWIEEDPWLEKSQADGGYWEEKLVTKHVSPGPSGQFYSYGYDDVVSASIQKNKNLSLNVDLDYNIGYVTALGGNNYFNNYIKSSAVGSIYWLSNPGIEVQMINGSSTNEVRGITFQTSFSPYAFKTAVHTQAQAKQEAKKPIYKRREGIIYKDSAQFYFGFGDITVDQEEVRFVPIADTLNFDSLAILNSVLTSEPFKIAAGSTFMYSVNYGITDSLSASLALGESHSVTFRTELIDDLTGEIIGIYDPVVFSKQTVKQYANIGYEVGTEGVGNRTVRLRIIAQATFDAKFSVADQYEIDYGLNKHQRKTKHIDARGSLIVKEYNLSQNYPNPFNPNTTISYALPKEGMVTIKIYDALGREVKTLVNEFKSSGRYTAEFDASRLASGVYIYKLVSGDYSAVKKMMLVK